MNHKLRYRPTVFLTDLRINYNTIRTNENIMKENKSIKKQAKHLTKVLLNTNLGLYAILFKKKVCPVCDGTYVKSELFTISHFGYEKIIYI